MSNKKFYQIGIFVSFFFCINLTAGLESLPTKKQETILTRAINNFLLKNGFVTPQNKPTVVVSKKNSAFYYISKPNYKIQIPLQEAVNNPTGLEFSVLHELAHACRDGFITKNTRNEELEADGMATAWATNKETCQNFIESLKEDLKTDLRVKARPDEYPTPIERIRYMKSFLQHKDPQSLTNRYALLSCIEEEIKKQTESDK